MMVLPPTKTGKTTGSLFGIQTIWIFKSFKLKSKKLLKLTVFITNWSLAGMTADDSSFKLKLLSKKLQAFKLQDECK